MSAPAPRSGAPTLETHPSGPRSTIWWGMLGLIGIEIVVFGGLITSYLYLKLYNPEWPPAGINDPDLLLPTVNTAILLLSSAAVYFGDRGIQQGKSGRLVLGQSIGILLGLAFLAIKVVEYAGYDYDWSTHAYGSITWTMSGFHAAHVLSVVLKGIVVLSMALRGMFTPERRSAVEVNGLYWHFVALIWLPLYFTLYITPRL